MVDGPQHEEKIQLEHLELHRGMIRKWPLLVFGMHRLLG
jgi:hypothetical protein